MAAIISQMAANKRARQINRQTVVSSDKCVHTIPPFDPCFNPVVHNKYMRAMNQRRMLESRAEILARVKEEKKREEKQIQNEAKVISDLVSGFIILLLGLSLILILVIYIWLILWNVDDNLRPGRVKGVNVSKIDEE